MPVTVGAVVLPIALITAVAGTARLPLLAASSTASAASATVSITVASIMVLRSSSTVVPTTLAALVCATLPPPDPDGDLGPIDRADVLAERQDHLRAVGRRRRRIGAGGDERRADAVDLVVGVDGDRDVVEVDGGGRAAGGVDRAAGELVRPDRDAVRGRVVDGHRVVAPDRASVRVGQAGCRFRCAGKVKLQLRGAGDVDLPAEGHRRLDYVADGVGAVSAGGGGQRDAAYRGDGDDVDHGGLGEGEVREDEITPDAIRKIYETAE